VTDGNAPELLDSGDVAMAGISRQTVRLAAEESCVQRIDSAFRFLGAYRVTSVSLNRVSPDEGAGELCAGVSRDLGSDALQDGFGSPAREQGTGNG